MKLLLDTNVFIWLNDAPHRVRDRVIPLVVPVESTLPTIGISALINYIGQARNNRSDVVTHPIAPFSANVTSIAA
jgi:hypothetical protein